MGPTVGDMPMTVSTDAARTLASKLRQFDGPDQGAFRAVAAVCSHLPTEPAEDMPLVAWRTENDRLHVLARLTSWPR